ncbi:SLC13 family permease [Methermicoccus shengliensis]|uniref:Anion transporter n=2 Tax=Methermicoccus shengliensis TaxID=660064 RepID=A0A832RWS3_9EURY|nr:anion transporter [Methermicoccus shengliensis]
MAHSCGRMWLSIAILLITYVLIVVQRLPMVTVDRAAGALIGASAMLAFGVLTFDEAIQAIDFPILALLLGMMIVVAYVNISGIMDVLSCSVLKIAKTPLQLLILLTFVSGLLSAFFVNDAVCIALTPIVIRTLRKHLNPVPYLITLATSSNIGSVMTIVGNPQNMVIGLSSGASFFHFFMKFLPIGLAGLLLNIVVVYALYRDEMRDKIDLVNEKLPSLRLTRTQLTIYALTLLGVVAGFLLGDEMAVVALTGAAILLLTGDVQHKKVFKMVRWELLLFFAGLFVVVGGVEKQGFMELILSYMDPLLSGTAVSSALWLSVLSVVMSNVVGNVPLVIMLSPIVPHLPDPMTSWYVLAMASTFGGNLTFMGSVASLIVVELSRAYGVRMGFFEFARVGVPLCLLTIAMGIALLLL